jgi:hypothetical protein
MADLHVEGFISKKQNYFDLRFRISNLWSDLAVAPIGMGALEKMAPTERTGSERARRGRPFAMGNLQWAKGN